MSDAISRSALIEFFEKAKEHPDNLLRNLVFLDGVLSVIDSAPAIDAVPVVHARWIYSGDMDLDGNSQGYCSRCGAGDKHRADLKNFVPYCWKCGARMDAKEER